MRRWATLLLAGLLSGCVATPMPLPEAEGGIESRPDLSMVGRGDLGARGDLGFGGFHDAIYGDLGFNPPGGDGAVGDGARDGLSDWHEAGPGDGISGEGKSADAIAPPSDLPKGG
jgi:hypothetical protein